MNQTNPPPPPHPPDSGHKEQTVSRLASTTWHAVEFSKNGRAPLRPSRTPQEATVQTYPTTPTPSTTRPKHSPQGTTTDPTIHRTARPGNTQGKPHRRDQPP